MTVGVKVYRFHRCDRRHREWWTLARCIWPKAEWITGDGPFASVSLCGGFVYRRQVGPTIVLFPTEAEALSVKGSIDRFGCGGRCRHAHEVIRLERGTA